MCAIFGVLDYKGKLEATQRLRMVRELGKAAEIRGTDATGIAYFQHNKLYIQKAPKFDDIAIADDFGNWWMDVNYRYSRFEKEHWAYILEIGQSRGIPESELELLSKVGYSFADIEELLYDDVMRRLYLEEARRELESWRVC